VFVFRHRMRVDEILHILADDDKVREFAQVILLI